jgi:hypothetical protein
MEECHVVEDVDGSGKACEKPLRLMGRKKLMLL